MRRLPALLLAYALLAALPGSAAAAGDLRVGIADDAVLLHDPLRAPQVVARWAALGIDTVRIHARWVAVAPDPDATRRPEGFDPKNPEDPGYDFSELDAAVDLVRAFGMRPMLAVTGSGPVWGTKNPAAHAPRVDPAPYAFADFATAVARRYGSRVDQYLIWNEPNQPLWLQPQSSCADGRCTPVAPHRYRELVRAAYPAIHRADPVAQVIAGTLSPRGQDAVQRNRPLRPLAFLRAFGCVDAKLGPVRTGRCRGFRPATIDGFAIHPHGVQDAPDVPARHPDDVQLADLPDLERTLDGIQRARGLRTPTGAHPRIHLTEFGFQTDPPDLADGVSLVAQRRWLQQAAFLAWRDPRVATLVQYEWGDERVRNLGAGRRRYSGWQSGLVFADGRPKPALAAFAHPFWAAPAADRRRTRFWGQVRPGATHRVQLQRRTATGWTVVSTLSTDARGYWTLVKRVDRAGDYRFRYADDRGAFVVSDVVRAAPPPRRHAPTRG